jgi:ParB-like chromosome segregation protein Spo0J
VKIHPAANIFPMMTPSQLEDLADSIAEHGLIEPIRTLDDQIIDGRNREQACKMASVAPRYRALKWNDPMVISKILNLDRRHLTESQRAMVAARMALESRGDESAVRPDLAVSVRSEAHAARVLNKGSSVLKKAVDAGMLPVSTASALAGLPKKAQAAVMKAPNVKAAARKAIAEMPKAPNKRTGPEKWKFEKDKIVATVQRVQRMVDELAEEHPPKNNVDKRSIECLQKLIEHLSKWK